MLQKSLIRRLDLITLHESGGYLYARYGVRAAT